MRLAYVHPQDVNDKNLWSGTVYYIYQGIKKHFDDVVVLSPIKEKLILLKYVFRIIESIFSKVTGKQQLNLYSSFFLPMIQGRAIDKFIKNHHVDCIVSTTSSPFIYTKNNVPLFLITDATVKLLYEEYSNGKGWSKLYYSNLEKCALKVTQKSALLVASSDSTAYSLINDYNIPVSKIVTIPFGANIDNEFIQILVRNINKDNPVKFLFIGRDWERKGGDFAVSICDKLIKQKVNIHLDIVGCSVPEKFNRTYLTNYVFLDKNKKGDYNALKKLYSEAHFFMVFSKAEMYGIVFCEAAAYGLPVVTFAVGGITDIVINDKTGIILPKDTKAGEFVSKISDLISTPGKYVGMSTNARKRYDELLNWDVFTNSLKNEIHKRLN